VNDDSDPTADPGARDLRQGDDTAAPAPVETEVVRATSEKQIAANRANARKSTGPSEQGKAKSARNATKSGVWAKELHPIGAGPFAEAPEDFFARAADLIGAYDPRDAREFALAKRAASALIRLDRMDALEAAILLETTYFDDVGKALFPHPRDAERRVKEIDFLDDRLHLITEEGDPDETLATWQILGTLLLRYCPNPEVDVPPVLTRERKPATEDEWKQVALAVFSQFWIDEDSCSEYLYEKRCHWELTAEDRRKRFHAAIAKRMLNATTNQLDRPRTAAWREFSRAADELRRLQTREMWHEE